MTDREVYENRVAFFRNAQNATIERCAQVADNAFKREDGLIRAYIGGQHIAAAIRALKEKP